MAIHKKAPVRRGRRVGESSTRQAILEAARARFGNDGYAATTIRKVAADAGVDAALVMQFFGTKEDLFAAVMSLSADTLAHFGNAFAGPEPTLGERVTRAFLQLWEGPPEVSQPLLAMLRAAVSNEHTSAQVRDFVQARLVQAIVPKMKPRPDATRRAGLAASMLVGLIVGRRLVALPAVAETPQDAVVRLVGAAIQVVLVAE